MFSRQPLQFYSKLNKAVLCAGIMLSFSTFSVQAELILLSESSLSKVTGQSGLTIDLETRTTIAEVEYVDAGSLYWKDYSFEGIGGGLVDNIRITIDSTDGNETLATGFSDLAFLASLGYLDSTETDVAWAMAEFDDGNGAYGKQFNDGDLVIHVTSKDYGIDFNLPVPTNATDQATNLQATKNAVDFHMQQGDFGLRSSDKLVETSLTRNFSVEAYLGYLDIILRNNGNGFTDTGMTPTPGKPKNIRLADSYIELDLKFRVEDLDVDSTNNATNRVISRAVTNPYLTLRDMRIHNERGADTLGSFGFASVEAKIGAATGVLSTMDQLEDAGASTHVDGQAIYDVNVRWDWDLPHISFGDTGDSIGAVYLTDFNIYNTSIVITAK
jgi:hypothetical protein|tara:strand:- start:1131 stop:2285 length:1155 start_codon:yes stop_codon:yes gene_type:complete